MAVYSKEENGVGYFSSNGEILCAEFSHVAAKSDHQVMDFNNRFKNRVEVTVKNGKVNFKISSWKSLRKKAA